MSMPEPQIGQPLPHADDAIVVDDKIIHYVLDPEHPVGKHKAAVFARALNIEISDWEYLRDRILSLLPEYPVTGERPSINQAERYTWEVLLPIKGLGDKAERELLVVTAWEMLEDRPFLTTLRVARKSHQRRESR